jgi:hypothetical protein
VPYAVAVIYDDSESDPNSDNLISPTKTAIAKNLLELNR